MPAFRAYTPDVSDRYDEADEDEEESAPPPRPKPRRRPVDWFVVTLIVGSLLFFLVFGAITMMAPRRPFLLVRFAQSARPAATAPAAGAGGVQTPAAGTANPAATPAAPAPKP